MNTQRINQQVDLAINKLISKRIVDLPKTLDRIIEADYLLPLIPGETIEEKALNKIEKLKELILLDRPVFFTQHVVTGNPIRYRLNRDQFDEHIADYLLSFSIPTTENIDISLWRMRLDEPSKEEIK